MKTSSYTAGNIRSSDAYIISIQLSLITEYLCGKEVDINPIYFS